MRRRDQTWVREDEWTDARPLAGVPRDPRPWRSDRDIIAAAVFLVVLTVIGFAVGAWWAIAHWWPA